MKTFLALFLSLMAGSAIAQSFHFDTDSTALVKTTDQSPAHWYLEVINDVGVDTTLRWKASFVNMEAAWEISFDDQDNYHPQVFDGDSADFTAFGNLTFPQKLIIGNTLNNTTGNGKVYFDVYDPQDLATTETIVYHFIISQGTASISTVEMERWYTFGDNTIEFSKELLGEELRVYSLSGQVLLKTIINGPVTLEKSTSGAQVQLIRVANGDVSLSTRVVVE